jgi:hypothetical protein
MENFNENHKNASEKVSKPCGCSENSDKPKGTSLKGTQIIFTPVNLKKIKKI